MAADGDIDFTAYTREELDGATTRIDRERYPINARNLIEEYQRRRVAEKLAAEQSCKSETAILPDRMLSAPKAFDVTFEPGASVFNWLGPSRNDFHLVGSGTVRVDDTLVRVRGRRYAYLIGIPVIDTEDLGRRYVVNVETQGRAVRFELRVPEQKVRGITIWSGTQAEAVEVSQLLPSERTTDFTPQLQRHVEFERALIAQSPKTPVTYSLLGLCIFVYLGTALGTDQWWDLSGPSLIELGSNFGPYTTSGDWWRLVTCMFLHAGVIHLAFNMWALVAFGRAVERLFGSVWYTVIYFTAGITGSLGSVIWDPAVNSVGASGAIFGVFGALIAAQVRNDGSIPINILRPFKNSSLIFTAYALFAGLRSTEVDNAAHLAGVATGFLMGLMLSRPITGLRLKTGAIYRRVGLAVVTSGLVLGIGVSTAKSASTRLRGESLYWATAHWFRHKERNTLDRFQELAVLAEKEKWDENTYANRIEREVIPFWSEADVRFAKVQLRPSSGNFESLQWLQSISHDRLHAYQLTVQSLRKDDNKMADRAVEELQRIERRASERAKVWAAKR
jgi:rhomboid protease GluP